MFNPIAHKRIEGFLNFQKKCELEFIERGPQYVEGYLDGVGPVIRFLARFGLPGTAKTTRINCAEKALVVLKKK